MHKAECDITSVYIPLKHVKVLLLFGRYLPSIGSSASDFSACSAGYSLHGHRNTKAQFTCIITITNTFNKCQLCTHFDNTEQRPSQEKKPWIEASLNFSDSKSYNAEILTAQLQVQVSDTHHSVSPENNTLNITKDTKPMTPPHTF